MDENKKLQVGLFLLRITVFLVMFMWTLDKLVRPEHGAAVFQVFYRLPLSGEGIMYAIGALELIVIFGFLLGIFKSWTYGLVLVFHLISTLSAYQQYLMPFESVNLLFFAAWPMLAACICLFLLREEDTFFTWKKS